jgi:glycosyltransferase involved in cell wall biosynthesis
MTVRPLRIGIDARELLGETTGVGRYLGELLRRWTGRADGWRRAFTLYTPEPLAFLEMVPRQAAVHERVAGRGRGTWWEQTHLRRAIAADPPDVFFAPAYTAPLALSMPLAVTIHDVSFAAHPEWFTPREGARRRLLTRRAAGAAAAILTDSQFSRAEIERHLGVASAQVEVIYPGVTSRAGAPVRREPLVLFAGSVFNRRRLPSLMAAFARVAAARPRVRLVIAGADRTYPPIDLRRAAEALNVADRVDIREYVEEAELAALYRRASVFAFLSEYEGFGFPPLEALSAGTPVLVLDTPIAREIYGPAARYVDPEAGVEAAAAALAHLLDDPSAATPMLAHAPAILARYSWDRAAAATLAAIERIAPSR